MRTYIIRRVLLVIPTLLILSILVFLSVRFIPGDVIDVMNVQMEALGGGTLDREAVERMLGLDVPVYVQYGRWIGGILLRGTLGNSLLGQVSVEEQIIGRLPVTLELGLMAILIGLVIALPVGIYSAIRQDTVADFLGRSVAIIGLATPNFWLGIMVMIYPATWWGWAPPLELPGLGRLLLIALNNRDYPMVSGINLFFATGVVGINLFIDLVYAVLDPRVRYD